MTAVLNQVRQIRGHRSSIAAAAVLRLVGAEGAVTPAINEDIHLGRAKKMGKEEL